MFPNKGYDHNRIRDSASYCRHNLILVKRERQQSHQVPGMSVNLL